jgi:hypothetical protein
MGFDGSGTRGDVGEGSPFHRPAVAFGARRASVPARRPAVACGVCDPRTTSATSGRLDGLLGGCDALLRHAIPEGAPLENVPKHARSVGGTFSRTARPPVRPVTCSWGTRFSVPAVNEQDRNGGAMRPGPMARSQSFRRWRFGRRRVASSSAMTGSATRASKNLTRQQRPRAHFRATGVVSFAWTSSVTDTVARWPCPGTVTGPGLSADADPDAAAAAGTWFSVEPACRRVRRSSRLRSGSPP